MWWFGIYKIITSGGLAMIYAIYSVFQHLPTPQTILYTVIIFAFLLAINMMIVYLWNKRKIKIKNIQIQQNSKKAELDTTVPYIKIGDKLSDASFLLLVTVKFEPSMPIQLGLLDLVYKPNDISKYITLSPLDGLPTRLIERVETYEVKYEIPEFRGNFLLNKRFRELGDSQEKQWPKAYLHILAGNLDYQIPLPSPRPMSTLHKEDSQM